MQFHVVFKKIGLKSFCLSRLGEMSERGEQIIEEISQLEHHTDEVQGISSTQFSLFFLKF